MSPSAPLMIVHGSIKRNLNSSDVGILFWKIKPTLQCRCRAGRVVARLMLGRKDCRPVARPVLQGKSVHICTKFHAKITKKDKRTNKSNHRLKWQIGTYIQL
jgi:hypothetical protein